MRSDIHLIATKLCFIGLEANAIKQYSYPHIIVTLPDIYKQDAETFPVVMAQLPGASWLFGLMQLLYASTSLLSRSA